MAKSRKRTPMGPYNPESRGVETFGGRVREMRIEWAWTQQRLADALWVGQGTIAKWENSKEKPSGTTLKRLEAITGITVDAWRTGEDWVLPNPPLNLHGHLFPDDLAPRVLAIPDVNPGIWQIDPTSEWDCTKLTPEQAIKMVKDNTQLKGTLFLIPATDLS